MFLKSIAMQQSAEVGQYEYLNLYLWIRFCEWEAKGSEQYF